MVQSVSASVTDISFRLGEPGVGSNPFLVGHHRDYHNLTILLYIFEVSIFESKRGFIRHFNADFEADLTEPANYVLVW